MIILIRIMITHPILPMAQIECVFSCMSTMGYFGYQLFRRLHYTCTTPIGILRCCVLIWTELLIWPEN
jgi:hypothetical protein